MSDIKLRKYHGRWKGLPEIVLDVEAESAGKARYKIFLEASDAYPGCELIEIEVRAGEWGNQHWMDWDEIHGIKEN